MAKFIKDELDLAKVAKRVRSVAKDVDGKPLVDADGDELDVLDWTQLSDEESLALRFHALRKFVSVAIPVAHDTFDEATNETLVAAHELANSLRVLVNALPARTDPAISGNQFICAIMAALVQVMTDVAHHIRSKRTQIDIRDALRELHL